MINENFITMLIISTPGHWHKINTTYILRTSPTLFATSNIYIDTSGPVPSLVVEEKPEPLSPWETVGPKPKFVREPFVKTDLDPFTGYMGKDGRLNFWIAKLLDIITDGEVPADETIQATIQEGKRQGVFRPEKAPGPQVQ